MSKKMAPTKKARKAGRKPPRKPARRPGRRTTLAGDASRSIDLELGECVSNLEVLKDGEWVSVSSEESMQGESIRVTSGPRN